MPRRLRLALLLYRHRSHSGLSRALVTIAGHLRNRGHDLTVFTRDWQGEVPSGIAVRRIPVRALTNHGRDAAFARAALPLARAGGFDGIVGFNKMPGLDIYYGGDACYRDLAHRDHGPLYRLTPRYRTRVALESAVFAAAAGTEILALSPLQIEAYRRHYATPAERFHLLPPGISRERRPVADAVAARASLRGELGIGAGETMLLTVGSGYRTKGVDRSIRALAALPPQQRQTTRLVVVGEGDAAPQRRLAARLGIADRVIICGGRNDIMACYAAADLMLHPARWESGGAVLLEAMIGGLPVLCTAACGFAWHVEQAGAGSVLAEPFAQDALNAALAAMMAPDRRQEWSRNARRYVETTDIYSGRQRAAELIEAIIARTAGTRPAS